MTNKKYIINVSGSQYYYIEQEPEEGFQDEIINYMSSKEDFIKNFGIDLDNQFISHSIDNLEISSVDFDLEDCSRFISFDINLTILDISSFNKHIEELSMDKEFLLTDGNEDDFEKIAYLVNHYMYGLYVEEENDNYSINFNHEELDITVTKE